MAFDFKKEYKEFYLAWSSSVTGVNFFDTTNTGGLLANIILLFINNNYYSRRSELFVN